MDPYCGEIRLFGGSYAPENWALCQGQILNVNDYQVLFAVIGTTYGGNGVTTFGLPDLRGRVPIGMGQGSGLTPRTIGQKSGASTVQVSTSNLPAHTHTLYGSNKAVDTPTMAAGVGLATTPSSASGIVTRYANPNATTKPTEVTMDTMAIAPDVAGMQPHSNVMPYQAINYIICVNGLYPERG